MWNSITAIAAAAFIAAAITLFSAPAAEVAAKIPAGAHAPLAMAANCAELAWPYNRCSDGRLVARGGAIRLVTADRLPAN